MLGEDNQRRAGLVQSRVHAAGDFHAARERQADVDAVRHLVGRERAADLLSDFRVRGNLRECKG